MTKAIVNKQKVTPNFNCKFLNYHQKSYTFAPQNSNMTSSNRAKGYTLAIIGSMCYGLNPLFALPLYDKGVDPVSVLLYRYAFAVLLIGLLLIIKGEGFKIKRKEFLMSMAMGLFFALSSLFLFLSFKEMDAGIASTILFTYPLFVVLMMAAFFKEKTGIATWISLLCAGSGIALLYEGDGGTLSTYGIILVLLSAVTYAVYLVGVNRSVLHSLPTLKLAFFATLSGAVLFLIISILGSGIARLTTWEMWGNAFGLSFFTTFLSLALLTSSIHIIGSTPASIIGALEPITALVVSLTVFGGSLTVGNCIGIALIITAVVVIVKFGKNRN